VGSGSGHLGGFVNVDLGGALGAASITDAGGTPLPNATLTSDSGFDYLAPEPAAGTAPAALLALVALRRRLRASR
jgi:uncharacterized protein (TIGR03382 family)